MPHNFTAQTLSLLIDGIKAGNTYTIEFQGSSYIVSTLPNLQKFVQILRFRDKAKDTVDIDLGQTFAS